MKMIESVIVEDGGKITLPDVLRDRYGLAADARIRIIETRNGILLVPLTDEPMSEALAEELRDWQSLGTDALGMFPYDGDGEA